MFARKDQTINVPFPFQLKNCDNRKIFHPHCVLFMGASTTQGKLKIITELMHTDCERLLKQPNVQLSLPKRIRMLKDAALGYHFINFFFFFVSNLLLSEWIDITKTKRRIQNVQNTFLSTKNLNS